MSLLDCKQRLVVFHGLGVLHQNFGDSPVLVGLDLVQDFHCLNDAERIAHFDLRAQFDAKTEAMPDATMQYYTKVRRPTPNHPMPR